jgi:SAM-dependent methyltransferase
MERALELTYYAERTHFWFRGFRQYVIPVLRDVTHGRQGLRLLDCGCGTGFNLNQLREYGRAVGYDLLEPAVRWTKQRGLSVARADATRVPFKDASFDVVTCFDMLESVPDDRAAIAEMARVVVPGGAVVLCVPAFEFLSADHAISWSEVHRYTPASIRRVVESTGLRVERVSFMFASLFPLIVASRLWQRLVRPLRGVRADADISVPSAPVNRLLSVIVEAEARLARTIPMPVGSSILLVARKP